jgi:tripeptidyl-peptidase-2
MRPLSLLFAVSAVVGGAFAQQIPGWTQLSLSTCRVDNFLAANPESNGRGVVVAILDTGVDPSIPGLTHTPDGAVKVIDIQDFTGDGDVELHRIRLDEQTGKLVEYNDEGEPIEYDPPTYPAPPAGVERLWWLGTFDESKFVNSDQPDLNDNGTKNDKFRVLVTALSDACCNEHAVAYVDTNLDRSFADEKALQDYKINYDTFTFHRTKPEKQIIPFAFSLNIFLNKELVVICFDNGAHGTHVAGIAAGYEINGQPGFNGVAPGAKIISLKIGNGSLGGVSVTESMKKAFEYAGRYAHEHDVPVVCNMSFGVESETEGYSDIDKFADKWLRANPYSMFCSSAGNSGPGLSTIGTPAAASDCICVGALMAADTARDVAGYDMQAPSVTVFSSRGGELDKPDVVTPGWSTSTVPRWNQTGDFWAGTSMASPYAAGLCADLISHELRADPEARVRGSDVRRALWLSAKPLAGATPLDQGFGVPDLPKAAEVLGRLVKQAANDPIIAYDITTFSPFGYQGKSRAAYWRGTWFPPEQDRQMFTIKPVFSPLVNAEDRTAFTRKFELRSNAAWCHVQQESFYLRGEQAGRVYVNYDADALKEPGLYVAEVNALSEGVLAFRLLNTVIVPYRFTADENYVKAFHDQSVNGWEPRRYFLDVPAGASAMRLRLSAPEGKESKASFDRVYDPRGREFRVRSKHLDTEAGAREVEWSFTDELSRGVWEVDVHADRPDRQWPFELGVRFFGLQPNPAKITDTDKSKPKGEITVTNMFARPLATTAEGEVEGYRLHKEGEFEGRKDELTYELTLDERFNRVRLHLEMTPENYARTTDIAVMVENSEGEAIYTGAFDSRILDAVVNTKGEKSPKVVITAGFAVIEEKRKTPITVDIDQLLKDPVPVTVKLGEDSNITFVPAVPMLLEYAAKERLKDVPKGLRPVGFLRFRERSSNEEALRVVIDVGA